MIKKLAVATLAAIASLLFMAGPSFADASGGAASAVPLNTGTFPETCTTQVTPTTWFNVTFQVHAYWSGSFGQITSVSDANSYLSGVTLGESLRNFSFSSDISDDGQSVAIRGDAVMDETIAGQVWTSVPVACWQTWPITSLPS